MIFSAGTLDGIKSGAVTLAFRRWSTPRVKAGSTQRTRVGVIAFDSVEEVTAITEADAKDAGFSSAEELYGVVDRTAHGPSLYRIALRYEGADPRVALREADDLTPDDVDDLRRRFARMDARGAWTEPTLRLIGDNPGVVSTELARTLGANRAPFKQRVRKLKELGLTESLEVGYRLSPRGVALLKLL
ncbi:winged helix-turn-helix transcriptional regulator [Rhodococcus sp. NPDC058521]|uniref:winged helix-turn-helix transcriptional regulator n=1 Tax=Rhodococcus sp. NPDC058521 TaxID=3346536 RepID=UPI0036636BF3